MTINFGTYIAMSALILRKSKTFPVRYKVYLDDKLVFSVSPPIARTYLSISELSVLKNGESCYISLPISELETAEKNFLHNQAFTYLAKGERSPRQLRLWLENRLIPSAWREPIIALCKQKNFLSPQRFTAAFVARRFQQANKPWRHVNFELEHHEISPDLISRYTYDDLTMLKAAYLAEFPTMKITQFLAAFRTPATSATARHKLSTALQRQGFSFATIAALLAAIESQESK